MVGQQRFLVRFWGVRGSYPVPGPGTLHYGGNTSCVEVQVGQHTLILDAGSGIIGLGEHLMQQRKAQLECKGHYKRESQQRQLEPPLNVSLLITHGHGDHLIGFPFFAPLFDPHTILHVFGPYLENQTIEQLVTQLMSPPYFPVDVRFLPSQRTFHTIADEQRIVWAKGSDEPIVKSQGVSDQEVCVVAKFTGSHPLNGALIYRIEYAGRRIVYATDVEWSNGYDPDFLTFVEGVDLLIHDAQYTRADYQQEKQGYGHSSVDMALEVASVARVRKLILFHHEPTYDDRRLKRMEAEAQTRFADTRSAYEGMEIDLLSSVKD